MNDLFAVLDSNLTHNDSRLDIISHFANSLFHTSSDGIIIANNVGNILLANHSMQLFSGFDDNELTHFNITDIFPSLFESAPHKKNYVKMKGKDREESCEVISICYDDYELTYYLIRPLIPENNGAHWKEILAVLNNYPEVMYVCDLDTYEVLFVNDSFAEKLGTNPIGEKCYKVFQNFQSPCPFCTNERLRKSNGEEYVWEYNNPVLNRDYLLSDQLIKWPDGRNVRFEVAFDITERKMMEGKLRESENNLRTSLERYEYLFDSAAVALWEIDYLKLAMWIENLKTLDILDIEEYLIDNKEEVLAHLAEINILDVNSECVEIFEASSKQELITRLNSQMISESYDILISQVISLFNGNKLFEAPYTINISQKKKVEVQLNISFPNEIEKYNSVLVSAVNINEIKRKERELNELLEKLERSNKELEQFAYVASHDLQEPLRMVASFTQLLEKKYGESLDDSGKEYIYYAVDGANRMQRLINDLLEYSRVSTKGSHFEDIDLTNVVSQAIANLRKKIEESNAVIAVDDLPKINGDPNQLIRLFQNLIDNSIKFCKEESPLISISAQRNKNKWAISVADNGIGIDEKYNEKIFQIFQRLHRKEDYPGTGIGLSICKRIVERHGGDIWVKPNGNKGTTFSFTI